MTLLVPLHCDAPTHCLCLRHWDYSSYPVMQAPLYFRGQTVRTFVWLLWCQQICLFDVASVGFLGSDCSKQSFPLILFLLSINSINTGCIYIYINKTIVPVNILCLFNSLFSKERTHLLYSKTFSTISSNMKWSKKWYEFYKKNYHH